MEAIKQPNQNESVNNVTSKVYVGTYAKYNDGSIEGQWVSLEGHDKNSFDALCRSIHADESDPEIMLQDFEGFPKEYYGESGLDAKIWEWLELDDEDKELLAHYIEAIGDGGDIEDAREAFVGKYDSEAEFTEELARNLDVRPDDLPHWIVIDWEATWKCNLRYDYATSRDDQGRIWFFRQ